MRRERSFRVIYYQALARHARAMEDAERQALLDEALDEYEASGGAAPSWNWGDVSTALTVSKGRAHVSDRKAWIRWVAERYPSEIVQEVQRAFELAVLADIAKRGGFTEDGEIVPGVQYDPPGQRLELRITPKGDTRRRIADQAAVDINQFGLGREMEK